MTRKPAEFHNFPLPVTFGPYRAVVKHWVDGDTLDVFIDLGLHKYAYETIRVHNINTPEIYGAKEDGEIELGRAARAYALQIAPVESAILIRTFKDRTSFGRYVADIELADKTDFATHMVENGHATWSNK